MTPTLHTVWVWNEEKGDWRAVKSKQPWQKQYRTSVLAKRAQHLQRAWKKKGRIVTVRKSSAGKPSLPPKGKRFKNKSQLKEQLVRKWLTGDLDAKPDLLYRLAQVARDIDTPLYVAEGQRSIKDQWKYWWAYKRGQGPLAAFPGTSRHTYGDAADVREKEAKGTRNVGDIPGARTAMARYGLALTVPGEAWHVEISNNWRN